MWIFSSIPCHQDAPFGFKECRQQPLIYFHPLTLPLFLGRKIKQFSPFQGTSLTSYQQHKAASQRKSGSRECGGHNKHNNLRLVRTCLRALLSWHPNGLYLRPFQNFSGFLSIAEQLTTQQAAWQQLDSMFWKTTSEFLVATWAVKLKFRLLINLFDSMKSVVRVPQCTC